jgi:hypothetical protein
MMIVDEHESEKAKSKKDHHKYYQLSSYSNNWNKEETL